MMPACSLLGVKATRVKQDLGGKRRTRASRAPRSQRIRARHGGELESHCRWESCWKSTRVEDDNTGRKRKERACTVNVCSCSPGWDDVETRQSLLQKRERENGKGSVRKKGIT